MLRITKAVLLPLGFLMLGEVALADSNDPNEMALENRQAVMELIGQNFGPMAGMMRGKIPWDTAAFAGYASDLEKLAGLNIMRGYIDGSHVGKTKAKPEIWKNKADFTSKMEDLAAASAKLSLAAKSGDKKSIAAAFKEAGGTCKSCHDDYKSKNYLN
ncbi:MAG: cytochrome c [Pseudomonadales bacterium]|nr:cytochrome c [Pseudomonadales bacterium]